MRSRPHYQPGDRIGGRYQVHQALMGGMGEVYLCLDLKENYPYALKTFQQRYLTSPRVRELFEEEVATWVALEKHLNIVRCYYMDTLDAQPFMILEWVASDESQGTDLRSWLRHGALDLRLALDFAIDIGRGLIHASEKRPGIVHRDLKPDNVLVAQGRLAKVTDFGLAQVIRKSELEVAADAEREPGGRQSLVGQRGIAGTPPYMAPEQWRDDALDARADIYAIGCILYEMLTGTWPFQAATLDGLRRQHLEADIPSLEAHQRLPGALDTLLARCLAKRREDRFASAGELLEQLTLLYQQEFAEPPKAVPPGSEFTAIDYNNRGATYADLQLYDEALADYEQTIRLDPEFAQVYSNRGATYHKSRHYEEALSDYERALQLDPTLAPVYNNRGATYYELQRHEEALTAYSSAIRLDPANATAYDVRGSILKELQRHDEALADYERAIQLDPTLASAHRSRAAIYYEAQQYDKALADYERAIQLDPTDAKVYHNRAATYLRLQRYEDALADYGEFIVLNPTMAAGYLNRGDVYTKLQQHADALEDYSRAIELDPGYAKAYAERGTTHFMLERYIEALEDYYQAIALDPGLARAYTNIGALIAQMGSLRVALSYLDTAAQLGDAQATEYIIQVQQELDEMPRSENELFQLAYEAFEFASSRDHVAQLVTQFPFMADPEFIAAVGQAMKEQVAPEFKLYFEQRLAWLRQIAHEQEQEERDQ